MVFIVKTDDVFNGNLNHLRFRVVSGHKSRLELIALYRKVDDEFNKLVRSLDLTKIDPTWFKLLKLFVGYGSNKVEYIDVGSKCGFCIRIQSGQFDLLKEWVDKTSDEKEPTKSRDLGKRKRKPDNIVDMETHRLNVLHGSK